MMMFQLEHACRAQLTRWQARWGVLSVSVWNKQQMMDDAEQRNPSLSNEGCMIRDRCWKSSGWKNTLTAQKIHHPSPLEAKCEEDVELCRVKKVSWRKRHEHKLYICRSSGHCKSAADIYALATMLWCESTKPLTCTSQIILSELIVWRIAHYIKTSLFSLYNPM